MLLFVAIASFLVLREVTFVAPERVSACDSSASSPLFSQDSWFWLEKASSAESRIMASKKGDSSPIVASGGISKFALSDNHLAWILKTGNEWRLTLSKLDGKEAKVVYNGTREPSGLGFAQKNLYWLLNPPAKSDVFGSFPPIGGGVEIYSLPEEGGNRPEVLSIIPEKRGLQFIGVNLAYAYVSAYRETQSGVTTIYRVSLIDRKSTRIAGETGQQNAILTPTNLLWTAPSPEASTRGAVVCVRYRPVTGIESGNAAPANLTDWMPARGSLFLSSTEVCYLDGSSQPKLWKLSDKKEFPVQVSVPPEYEVKSVAGKEILMTNSRTNAQSAALYRSYLP